MASANTCPALYYHSGVTHSQKCLGLEAKLHGSLGYTPEYPRKQVVPTLQSLPGPLVLIYSTFSAQKNPESLVRPENPMIFGILLVFLEGHLITHSLSKIETIFMPEEQLSSFW